MPTNYIEQRLHISDSQKEKVKLAIKNDEAVSIRIDNIGDDLIALTESQIKKINNAFEKGKAVTIKLGKQQLKYNKTHVTGGFIGALLAGLARYALPVLAKVLPALGIGALTGVGEVASKKILGNGLYMKRGNQIVKIKEFGNGIYLKPQPTSELVKYGNGIYMKKGGEIYGLPPGQGPYDGSGVLHDLLGSIPILNMLF